MVGKKKAGKKNIAGSTFLKEIGLKPDEGWASAMGADLEDLHDDQRSAWRELLIHAGRIESISGEEWSQVHKGWTGVVSAFGWGFVDDERERNGIKVSVLRGLKNFTPTEDWTTESQRLCDVIGEAAFGAQLAHWLADAADTRPGTLNQASANRETLRGLLWMWEGQGDVVLYDRVRRLGEHALNKRIAAGTMIAARLTQMQSTKALGQLVLLRDKTKSISSRGLFDILIDHVSDKIGVVPGDALEANVPSYGLEQGGVGKVKFGAYNAMIQVQETGKVVLSWQTPTGKAQKSVPAEVRREHKKPLKELKDRCKDISAMLASQRGRIERLYTEQRSWTYADWCKWYAFHPLLGTLTRRLLWRFGETDEAVVGLPVEDAIHDFAGNALAPFNAQTTVRLWHPLNSAAQDVLVWRERLVSCKIRQPFNQAYREIYELTDVERQTGTYSNRFAQHVLKQSQLRALGKQRGWVMPFMGGWDNGGQNPSRRLRAVGLRAEWALNEGAGDYAESGGLMYVGSDRIEFFNDREDRATPVPLDQIDPLALSEVMRDVDLFVGVASVGNDPNWQDGGPEGRYQDYWHSYSFGDLGATAQTRKEILQRLVPRLKIADRYSFDDKFLIVRGDKRTYKIHMGSSNILMEPNDQYLCIVPGRGDTKVGEKVFLPFEGDQRLAVILSKAMMLAEDAKIKDSTILSQIRR